MREESAAAFNWESRCAAKLGLRICIDARWNAHRHGKSRNVLSYHRTRTYAGVRTKTDLPKDGCARTQADAVSDGRDILRVRIRLPEGHPMVDRNVGADCAISAQHDAPACVRKPKPWAASNGAGELGSNDELQPDRVNHFRDGFEHQAEAASFRCLVDSKDRDRSAI